MVVLLVLVVVMLLVGVVREEHNLQGVVLDLFQLTEMQGLHFREEMVVALEEVDTSVAVVVAATLVVVLTVLAEVGLLISVHHF